MYAIIVGCGRVGSLLAVTMSGRGHNIVIIDSDAERFKKAGQQFTGETLLGDGTDISILKEGGIARADALIMATNDDNSNLMGAQIARVMFGVKRVIVRIKDPNKFSVYREYSLEMVSATNLAASKIFDILSTQPEIETIGSLGNGNAKIVRFRLASDAACKALSRLITSGIFYPVSSGEGENFRFSAKPEELAPGVLITGAIIADNFKHLARCCTEEKP